MSKSILLVLLFAFAANAATTIRAGISKINCTMPLGVPLAGYSDLPRRTKEWPLPKPTKYTTWMTPSIGVLDDLYCKCLILDDGQGTKVAFLTVNAIGMDGTPARMAYDYAVQDGFTIPFNQVILSGSHSHSGSGAVTSMHLFEIAPATDKLVPELQQLFAKNIAKALVAAEKNMQPAVFNVGIFNQFNLTHNRRADISKTLKPWSIDPQVGLFRVDDPAGKPIATLWNFAIHSICYEEDNLKQSADIAGKVNEMIEKKVGGVSLFVNADAGDINPIVSYFCQQKPDFLGAKILSDNIVQWRSTIKTEETLKLKAASKIQEFGPTNMNLTLERIANCTHGGPFNICSICEVLKCTADLHLDETWVENKPRFTAINMNVGGKKIMIPTIPGEALTELGKWIYSDSKTLGYDITMLFGYSNHYMGYFAPPEEYVIGGYESIMTFWGINTSLRVRDGVKQAMQLVS